MKRYRIVKDDFLGYEAQVNYSWLPFGWFQMNDFYWKNTWPTEELARHFIEQSKLKKYWSRFHHDFNLSGPGEFEKESKVLMHQYKNFHPEIIWADEDLEEIFQGEPATILVG